MSSVELTRPNTDVVNIEIEQENSSEAVCRFKLPFLLSNTDYVVGCSSLSVPMMNTRLLSTAYPELLYIRRRNVGQLITAAAHTQLDGRGIIAGIAGTGYLDSLVTPNDMNSNPVADSTLDLMRNDTVATLKTNTFPLLNISDFLRLLNNFAAVFQKRIHQVGIDPRFYGGPSTNGVIPPLAIGTGADAGEPQKMLNFGITPSGFLLVTMEPLFSNHFYISMTEMGKALLSLDSDILAVTQNQNTGVITRFGEGLFDAATNIIQPATCSVAVPFYSSRSLLQTLESRLSVHVETDLNIMRTIQVNNGQETSVYDLASFALKNESKSRIFMDGIRVEPDIDFESNSNCAQLVLQSRSDTTTQWSPILSFDELHQFRVRVYLKTKEYNPILKKWIIGKKKFPITEHDRWTLGLRFVSMM